LTRGPRARQHLSVDALATLRVVTDSMDAYDQHDFKRLEVVYAEGVRWVAVDPEWTCESRAEVFELFRSRLEANIHIDFDEIRATPGRVILRGRVVGQEPFVSLFAVQEGRITSVQDFGTVEALETALR